MVRGECCIRWISLIEGRQRYMCFDSSWPAGRRRAEPRAGGGAAGLGSTWGRAPGQPAGTPTPSLRMPHQIPQTMGHERFPSGAGAHEHCDAIRCIDSARRMTTGSLFVGREAVMSLAWCRAEAGRRRPRRDAGHSRRRWHRKEQGHTRVGGGGEHGRHANVARLMLPR